MNSSYAEFDEATSGMYPVSGDTIEDIPEAVPPQHEYIDLHPLPVRSPATPVAEFTRRKNWSQRILEELRDFIYVVGPSGKFIYASPSSVDLFDYHPADIIGRNIIDFIHSDDIDMFVRDFNNAIQVREKFSLLYRFRRKDKSYVILETNGHPHCEAFSDCPVSAPSHSQVCKCFFMSARPYPTRNMLALDSFLELKIENERLRKKLRELSDIPDSGLMLHNRRSSFAGESMPPPNMPARSPKHAAHSPVVSLHANTSGFLPGDESLKAIQLKMNLGSYNVARTNPHQTPPYVRQDYQATERGYLVAHQHDANMEHVDLYTGLQFKEGERGHGIRNGSISPNLVRDGGRYEQSQNSTDIGSEIAATGFEPDFEKPRRKNKKLKLAPDEYVCTDCGTTDSPEWRKGPMGAKTLCNACGLRYAKKQKRFQGSVEPSNIDETMGPPGVVQSDFNPS